MIAENGVFVRQVEKELKEAEAISPEAERRWLIEHVTGATWIDLMTGRHELTDSERRRIGRILDRRKKGEPLAHLLGEASFYGRTFAVSKDVLIPRPETERLVEEAIKILDAYFPEKRPRILDLGTGSGCMALSLTLERPACRMTALDVSGDALRIARNNRRIHGLQKNIRIVKSRFFESFRAKDARWDMIVSNPPYLRSPAMKTLSREVLREPRLALDGGKDGLEAVGRILREAPMHLEPGGWVLMELGDDQSADVRRLVGATGAYASCRFENDLNGIPRILIAQRKNG